MEFKKNQSIYTQIADYVSENILKLNWPVNEKISSVRELAGLLQVNPNTVMRTYSYLQDKGIIYNKRGIGYFVSDGAPSIISNMEKENFIQNELPDLFKKMALLNIDFDQLKSLYEKNKTSE